MHDCTNVSDIFLNIMFQLPFCPKVGKKSTNVFDPLYHYWFKFAHWRIMTVIHLTEKTLSFLL